MYENIKIIPSFQRFKQLKEIIIAEALEIQKKKGSVNVNRLSKKYGVSHSSLSYVFKDWNKKVDIRNNTVGSNLWGDAQ